MTVAEIRNAFEHFKDEIIDNERFYKWLNYIDHYLYEKLLQIEPENFITEESYVVSEASTSYALPINFSNINQQSCGFFTIIDEEPSSKLKTTAYNSKALGFFLKGNQVCFTGGISGNLLLRYIPQRTEINSDDSVLIAPNAFKEFYEQALSYNYAIDDDELEDEQNCQKRMQEKLSDLLKNYNRDQKTLDINMQNLY